MQKVEKRDFLLQNATSFCVVNEFACFWCQNKDKHLINRIYPPGVSILRSHRVIDLESEGLPGLSIVNDAFFRSKTIFKKSVRRISKILLDLKSAHFSALNDTSFIKIHQKTHFCIISRRCVLSQFKTEILIQ